MVMNNNDEFEIYFQKLAQALDSSTITELHPSTTIHPESGDLSQIKQRNISIIPHADLLATDDQELKNNTLTQKPPDPKIQSFQTFLKNNPLGISYSGPNDGIINSQLLSSLKSIENKLSSLSGLDLHNKIVDGNRVVTTVQSLQKFINKYHTDSEETKRQVSISNSPQVADLQSFFLQQKLYTGPVDGQLNSAVIRAAQQLEQILQQKTNNKNFQSSIWNGKNFTTTAKDLSQAIELINNNKNNQ